MGIEVMRVPMGEFESPNEIPALTAEEFRQLLANELGSLQADVRPTWERAALDTPVRMVHTWELDGREASAPVWVVARAGPTVLGYDEVEEEFGIGSVGSRRLAEGGVVDEWGTFGERLRWTLLRFPGPSAAVPSQAV
jgi:hypothetical protein